VSKDPNSVIRCGLFRQLATAVSGNGNFSRFLEEAESVRRKFPGTRLAICASAILADNEYQQGNYVSAIKVFKAELFAEHRSESAIIEDISSLIVLYNVNTLRTQGIDSGKFYESLAKYCYSLNRNGASVFCYRQSAKAKGFSLDAFERAASKFTKYSNTTAENEIWFWKGLFAAEDGDLMSAGLLYEKFLKTDAMSILAARAYYDTARARMLLGQYAEASEAITEAKRISPCESVIQMEWEIADAAASLRGRRESSTNTRI
jgi:tetratricopeptide (TPR) repeat protein